MITAASDKGIVRLLQTNGIWTVVAITSEVGEHFNTDSNRSMEVLVTISSCLYRYQMVSYTLFLTNSPTSNYAEYTFCAIRREQISFQLRISLV